MVANLMYPIFLALEFLTEVLPFTRSRSIAAMVYTTSAHHRRLWSLGIGPSFVLRQLSRNVDVVILDSVVRDLLKAIEKPSNSDPENETTV